VVCLVGWSKGSSSRSTDLEDPSPGGGAAPCYVGITRARSGCSLPRQRKAALGRHARGGGAWCFLSELAAELIGRHPQSVAVHPAGASGGSPTRVDGEDSHGGRGGSPRSPGQCGAAACAGPNLGDCDQLRDARFASTITTVSVAGEKILDRGGKFGRDGPEDSNPALAPIEPCMSSLSAQMKRSTTRSTTGSSVLPHQGTEGLQPLSF